MGNKRRYAFMSAPKAIYTKVNVTKSSGIRDWPWLSAISKITQQDELSKFPINNMERKKIKRAK